MILTAKVNGADLVKGQLYSSDDDWDKPYYGYSKQAELTFDKAKMIFDYAKSIGIEMFFSVFGIKYVKWCEKIGVSRYKIASGMVLNKDLVKSVFDTGKPVIMSLSPPYVPFERGGYPLSFLYCISNYPTMIGDLNFRAVDFQKIGYDGLSDHTIGLDASKIALARGAHIIEKHFAIDRQTGYEAEWSMIPEELKELKRWEAICKEVL